MNRISTVVHRVFLEFSDLSRTKAFNNRTPWKNKITLFTYLFFYNLYINYSWVKVHETNMKCLQATIIFFGGILCNILVAFNMDF